MGQFRRRLCRQLCRDKWAFIVLMGVAGALFAPASLSAEPRRFTFEYEATIGPVGAGAGPVDVFVPLAAENAQQRVRSEEIVASIPGAIPVERPSLSTTTHSTRMALRRQPQARALLDD